MYDAAFPSSTHQRARGVARVTFRLRDGATVLEGLRQEGSLKIRFPNPEPGAWTSAVLLNTSGGVASGDVLRIEAGVATGAQATLATQAAERIYRAPPLGGAATIRTTLSIAAGAALEWLPQETILFEGSRFRRRLEANLAPDASLLMVESTVFGRLAHGEASVDADFRDDWRIRRGGALVFAEAVRIADAGATLDRLAVGRGARALATLLYVTPDAPSRLDEVRAVLEEFADDSGDWLEAGASIVDGALVARALSPAPHRLRAALTSTMRVLRGREAPRVWG